MITKAWSVTNIKQVEKAAANENKVGDAANLGKINMHQQ